MVRTGKSGISSAGVQNISLKLPSSVKYIFDKISAAKGVTIQTAIRDALYYYVDNALVAKIKSNAIDVNNSDNHDCCNTKYANENKCETNMEYNGEHNGRLNLRDIDIIGRIDGLQYGIDCIVSNVVCELPVGIVDEYMVDRVNAVDKIKTVGETKAASKNNSMCSAW